MHLTEPDSLEPTAEPQSPPCKVDWRRRGAALATVILAGLWIWSALSKWGVPKAVELFGVIRDVFPWIPARLAERFAVALPKLELVLSLGLAAPVTRRWAGLGSMLLLLGFTAFLAQAWMQGYQNSCGCFGEVAPLSAAQARQAYGLAILRNLGLLGLAAMVWRQGMTRRR